jgi:Zn-dependent protease with chaperone function/tellurite resistance protein
MAPAAPAGRATLDFFAAQGEARWRTALLVACFALAVAAVTLIVYLAVVLLVGHAPRHAFPAPGPIPFFRPDLALPTAVGVWGVVGAGALFHGLRLSSGGEAVAAMLGGERIRSDTADPAERRLLNVVEEMALAAGMPVPKVYVLSREGGLNAFASGFTPDRAVVAVTRGALDRLTRDELQGVVAHELSHVLNADTRLDLRLMAAVGGLTVIALIGRVILENTGRSSRRGGGGVVLFGLALVVAGAIGTFFGNLVRFAVARQREWLADASAVQFTRNPDGLGGALRKIAAEGSALSSPRAPEASHLFFAAGTSGFLTGLLSTHPPIEERIRRLVPHAAARSGAPSARGAPSPVAAGVAGLVAPPAGIGTPGARPRDEAEGAPTGIPAPLRAAARDPFGARAVIAALLMDPDPAIRARQRATLGELDAGLAIETERLALAMDPAPSDARLAALDLALPALDDLSPAQGHGFAKALAALCEADGAVTPFEQAVRRAAQRRLGRRGAPPAPRVRRPEDASMECLELLSAIAWAGGRDARAAEDALRTGLRALGLDTAWRLLPRDRLDRAAFDRALGRLDLASFGLKRRILDAFVAAARVDGTVTPGETAVLRAIATALGVPSRSGGG